MQPLNDNENWKKFFSQLSRLIVSKPVNLKGDASAHFAPNQIAGVNYPGYPVFWLQSERPGEPIYSYVACVRTLDAFSGTLTQDHERNGMIIFTAGLFWDAIG